MRSYLFIIALLVHVTDAFSQHIIKGKVLDISAHKTLEGANIRIMPINKNTVSDKEGNFIFSEIPSGTYQIRISYVGYATRTESIDLKGDVQLDIQLSPSQRMTEEVIVTATRAAEGDPFTYSEFDKEEIEKNNLGQDIPFLIAQSPSVITTSDAGAGIGYTGIRIRGSDATGINVTINGIPFNDAESLGTFWVNLPDFASSIETIQVQRGVGTSTNGGAAFGGTINIQTTDFSPETYGTISNSFGSFNTRKHTVSLGTGLINNKFTLDARLSKINSDGYIDRASSDLGSYFISGGYHGKSGLVKINVFSGKEITYQSWYGTPESRINNDIEEMKSYAGRNGLSDKQAENLLSSGRTYNFYEYENQVDNYKQDHYQAIFAKDLNDLLTVNLALHYTHGQGFYEESKEGEAFSDYGLENISVGEEVIENTDLIRRRWLDNDFYGFTYAVNYSPTKKTNYILGGAWNRYKGDHFGEVIWMQYAGNSNIRQPYYDSFGDKKDFNSFLKVNHALSDRLTIFGDIQFRHVDYLTQGTDNDQRDIFEKASLDFFNPKLGASYQLNQNSFAYLSFSIGNREPLRNDFIDAPDTKTPSHETLRNLEAGFRKTGEKYNVQLNYYLMDYKNQLVLTGELNDVGANVRVNVPNSYRMGLELMTRYILNDRWKIEANATISRNKIKNFNEVVYDYGVAFDEYNVLENVYKNVDISFSPNIIAGSTLSYTPIRNAELSLLSKFVGKQFMDNTQNENRAIGQYFINDVRLVYDLSPKFMKKITFTLLINNIFDVAYEANGYTFGYMGGGETIRENFYYPQAGINFLGGVSFKF